MGEKKSVLAHPVERIWSRSGSVRPIMPVRRSYKALYFEILCILKSRSHDLTHFSS